MTEMGRLDSNLRSLATSSLGLPRQLERRARPLWIGAVVVAAVAIAVAAWGLSVDLLPLVRHAEARLADLRAISGETLLDTRDSNGLAELRTQVDRIESEVKLAQRSLDWLAHFSPALAWLPALDEEVSAWAAQADRLQRDLESASALLSASSQLLDAYGEIQSAFLSPSQRPLPTLLATQARDLESSFATSLASATEAARLGRERMPAFRTPRVRDAMALMDKVEERMLLALRIGEQASDLLVELVQMSDTVQPLLGQFVSDGYESEPLTVKALNTMLADLDERLQLSLAKSSRLARLVAESEQSEPFRDQLDTLQEVMAVLLKLNRATMTVLQAMEPALQSVQDSEVDLLGSGGGLISALKGIADHEDELAEAISLLEDGQQTLADLEFERGQTQDSGELRHLVTAVSRLRGGLKLVKDIARVGAGVVEGNSTQRYLVLGQSADELRATGGFVSAIWLVTFENGGLADVHYHDIQLVDDWDRLTFYPPAPPELEEHMNAHVWLLRDVSWEPDFPTVARTAADMYKIGQRLDVDGVVAINQWALLALVEGLGSIESPGGAPITPRNLLSKLEEGSDDYGRAYMDLTLQGSIDRLNQATSLSTLMKLASSLYGALQNRDMLLFMEDPELQAVIEENRWDGRVTHGSSDYLYIVDSNVGWSKADRNIERKVSYQVDMRRDRGARINLTLEYNNLGGTGSSGCVPQWLNQGTNYSALKNACYWNYWRVYTPQGARLLSNTPLPLPEYSVSVLIGRGLPGEDTVKVSSSYGRTVFSGLFDLGAGGASKFSLVYDLPSETLRRDGDKIQYQLLMQKQPGVRYREVTVEFMLPEGYGLASSSITPAFTGDSRVGFRFRIEQDTVLDAVFARGDDGPR